MDQPGQVSGSASPPAAVTAAPGALGIERRGIQHVQAEERWGKPGGLFWMWTGAIWNVEYVVYGFGGDPGFGSFTLGDAVIAFALPSATAAAAAKKAKTK